MISTILDFSGALSDEGLSPLVGAETVDCRAINGTNCYCDPQAQEQILEILKNCSDSLCWIDSGDYHYVSKLRCDLIRERFTLVLADFHPDMQEPAFPGVLSCGGWVRTMLEENPYLDKVIMYGTDPSLLSETEDCADRLTVFPCGGLPEMDGALAEFGDALSSEKSIRFSGQLPLAEGASIFLSIDKDALSPEYARTDWSQGTMTLPYLETLIKALASRCRILGVDICGALTREKGGRDEDFSVNAATDLRLYSLLNAVMS